MAKSSVFPNQEIRYYLVGCVLLAIALGFAIWAFSLDCLNLNQARILQWALPLSSGFAAGAFSGGLTVNSKTGGFLPGLIVTASGGFGVWLITVYFLLPSADDPGCATRRPVEAMIIDLRTSIVEQIGNYERATKYPGNKDLYASVMNNAWKYSDQIRNLDFSQVDARHQLIAFASGASGYLFSALAADIREEDGLEENSSFVARNAENALGFTQSCVELINQIRRNAESSEISNKPYWLEASRWLQDSEYPDNCFYMAATARVLLSRHAEHDIQEATAIISTISSGYLGRYPLTAERIFVWACGHFPDKKEELRCET